MLKVFLDLRNSDTTNCIRHVVFGTMMFGNLEHTVEIKTCGNTVELISCTQNTDEGNPNYELGFEKTHDGIPTWYIAFRTKTIHQGKGFEPAVTAGLNSEIETLLNAYKQLLETLYTSEQKDNEHNELVTQAKKFMTV